MLNTAFLMRILFGGLFFVFTALTTRAADNISITLTAAIPQSACTISFNPQTPLSLGDIGSTGLLASVGVVSTTKPVELTLSACGVGMSGITPAVTLNGTHPAISEGLIGADNSYAFKDDSKSFSKGFFIVVGKKSGTLSFKSGDIYKGDDTESLFPDLTGGSGEGAKASVYMGVTCGRATTCASSQAGGLQASLVFTFKYK